MVFILLYLVFSRCSQDLHSGIRDTLRCFELSNTFIQRPEGWS